MRRVIARNVLWNWAGMAIDLGTALLITPLFIHGLGGSTYGLWILIGSLSGYFGLLDLGVRGSVGRFIAFHRAEGDRRAVNEVLNSSLAITTAVGAVAMALGLVLRPVFFEAFRVPPGEASDVRLALLIVSVNLALSFPLSTFDGVLWGFQRFDVLNAIDSAAAVVRAALAFVVVLRGDGLVGLAAVTVLMTTATGVAKAWMSFREDPGLRIHPAGVSRKAAGSLYGYGLCNFVVNVVRMTRTQAVPMAVGSLLGLVPVTFYSIARRLIDYSERALVSTTGVLTPVAAALQAEGRDDWQRSLLIHGGRCCLALALFFLGGFVILGGELLRLWLGPGMTEASVLLTILIAGEVVPLSQCATGSMILGVARNRPLAWISLVELGILGVLLVPLVRCWGVAGACAAVAVSGTLCRGAGILVLGCRVAGMPVGRYLRLSMLPPLASAVGPAVGLAAAVAFRPPHGWVDFVTYSGLYTSVFAACCLPLAGEERLRGVWLRLNRPPHRGISASRS